MSIIVHLTARFVSFLQKGTFDIVIVTPLFIEETEDNISPGWTEQQTSKVYLTVTMNSNFKTK